jgi:hypothetical protein
VFRVPACWQEEIEKLLEKHKINAFRAVNYEDYTSG